MSDFPYKKTPWKALTKKTLLKTPIFELTSRECQPPSSSEKGEFFVLEAPDWINIFPLTDTNEVILVEQYRHGVDSMSLELPGGIIDPGESPETAASRELEEETGFRSTDWSLLGSVSSNPAILSNYTHLFLARNCQEEAQQLTDEFEDIAVHLMPLNDFFGYVEDGTIHHTIVVAAVTHFLLKYGDQF